MKLQDEINSVKEQLSLIEKKNKEITDQINSLLHIYELLEKKVKGK